MPNQTDLLNIALGNVGARRISAIDDGSANANHCATFYPAVLDGALRAGHWKFAGGRALLEQLGPTPDPAVPLFEYIYAWQLPSDFIKLREYFDSSLNAPLVWDWNDFDYHRYYDKFTIETYIPSNPSGAPPAKCILSMGNSAQIVYTRRITNPDLWATDFFWYVVKWLASELATAIPKDTKLSQDLMAEAHAFEAMALAVNGQEQSTQPIQSDSLTWGRW